MSVDLTTPTQLPNIPLGRDWDVSQRSIGRPSKLDQHHVGLLLEALEDGLFYREACSYAGISYQTLRNWIKKAESDIDAGELTEHVSFLWLLEGSLAKVEHEAVREWKAQFSDDWRAARDFLERRFPDRWGRKDTLDVNANVMHAVVMLPPIADVPADPAAIEAEHEVLDD